MVDIEDTGEALVTFTKSNVTAKWTATEDLSLLQLAEKAGLKPLYGCRSAMCGSCEVKITKGQVYGPEGHKPQGVLICQSRPATTEIELEL
jgi:ferredoxin